MEEEIDVIQENQENILDMSMEGQENIVEISPEAINVITNKDYEELDNKPRINAVELVGNKTSNDLKLQPEGDYPEDVITNLDIEIIINNFV